MGVLLSLSNLCMVVSTRRKQKPFQTVELRIKIDCDGCERRVKNAASTIKGVKTIEVNRKQNRVIVEGHVEANKVLKRMRNYTGKRVEFWPYIPCSTVHYPHKAYDKRAPSGYVRNAFTTGPPEETYTTLFSEDNPNACSIM